MSWITQTFGKTKSNPLSRFVNKSSSINKTSSFLGGVTQPPGFNLPTPTPIPGITAPPVSSITNPTPPAQPPSNNTTPPVSSITNPTPPAQPPVNHHRGGGSSHHPPSPIKPPVSNKPTPKKPKPKVSPFTTQKISQTTRPTPIVAKQKIGSNVVEYEGTGIIKKGDTVIVPKKFIDTHPNAVSFINKISDGSTIVEKQKEIEPPKYNKYTHSYDYNGKSYSARSQKQIDELNKLYNSDVQKNYKAISRLDYDKEYVKELQSGNSNEKPILSKDKNYYIFRNKRYDITSEKQINDLNKEYKKYISEVNKKSKSDFYEGLNQPNTYYENQGVYVDKSGQQMSVAKELIGKKPITTPTNIQPNKISDIITKEYNKLYKPKPSLSTGKIYSSEQFEKEYQQQLQPQTTSESYKALEQKMLAKSLELHQKAISPKTGVLKSVTTGLASIGLGVASVVPEVASVLTKPQSKLQMKGMKKPTYNPKTGVLTSLIDEKTSTAFTPEDAIIIHPKNKLQKLDLILNTSSPIQTYKPSSAPITHFGSEKQLIGVEKLIGQTALAESIPFIAESVLPEAKYLNKPTIQAESRIIKNGKAMRTEYFTSEPIKVSSFADTSVAGITKEGIPYKTIDIEGVSITKKLEKPIILTRPEDIKQAEKVTDYIKSKNGLLVDIPKDRYVVETTGRQITRITGEKPQFQPIHNLEIIQTDKQLVNKGILYREGENLSTKLKYKEFIVPKKSISKKINIIPDNRLLEDISHKVEPKKFIRFKSQGDALKLKTSDETLGFYIGKTDEYKYIGSIVKPTKEQVVVGKGVYTDEYTHKLRLAKKPTHFLPKQPIKNLIPFDTTSNLQTIPEIKITLPKSTSSVIKSKTLIEPILPTRTVSRTGMILEMEPMSYTTLKQPRFQNIMFDVEPYNTQTLNYEFTGLEPQNLNLSNITTVHPMFNINQDVFNVRNRYKILDHTKRFLANSTMTTNKLLQKHQQKVKNINKLQKLNLLEKQTKLKNKLLLRQKLINKNILQTRNIVEPELELKTRVDTINLNESILKNTNINELEFEPIKALEFEKPILEFEPITISPIKPPKKPTSHKPKPKKKVSITDAVNIYIKSKGKWNLIRTNKKLNYYSAQKLASELVDKSTARSYRIVKGKGKAEKIQKKQPIILNKFRKPVYRSRLPLGTFVEKSKFAIDSPTEKRGITWKGILASRTSRKKSKKTKRKKR